MCDTKTVPMGLSEVSAQADGSMNLGSRKGLGLEMNAGVLST